LRQQRPGMPQAERALFELGQLYFTAGEQRAEQLGISETHRGKTDEKEVFRQAIRYYEEYLKRYPKGDRRQEARFGIASCFEELDQLDEAIAKFQALIETYPAPGVIQIKVARLTERMKQRTSGSTTKKNAPGKKRRRDP
jgi:tetratricopeptide (TPR) repeat protein